MINLLFENHEYLNFQYSPNLMFITSHILCQKYKVSFGFMTRLGGVSRDRFKSLNLYLRSGDHKDRVGKNFSILFQETGLDNRIIFAPEQAHGSKVEMIRKHSEFTDKELFRMIPGTDGLVTAEKDAGLMCFYADCIPVIVFDKKRRVIGAIHSGWRSTAQNILGKTVERIKQEFPEIKEGELIFILGPYIDKKNFQVKQDAIDRFKKEKTDEFLVFEQKQDFYYIDLGNTVRNQLHSMNIPDENIIDSGLSTFDNPELFYSFRRDGSPLGEHIAFGYFQSE